MSDITYFLSKLSRATNIEPFFLETVLLYKSLRLVYRAIPKNACSTLKYSLGLNEGAMTEEEHPNEVESRLFSHSGFLKGAYSSMICLRDPFSRALSGYLDKICHQDEDFSKSAANEICTVLGLGASQDRITFEEFSVYLSVRPNRSLDIHWRPQVDFHVFDRFDNVIFFEKIGSYLELNTKYGSRSVPIVKYHKRDAANCKRLLVEDAHCIEAGKLRALRGVGYLPDLSSFYTEDIARRVFERYFDDFLMYYCYASQHGVAIPATWEQFGIVDEVLKAIEAGR